MTGRGVGKEGKIVGEKSTKEFGFWELGMGSSFKQIILKEFVTFLRVLPKLEQDTHYSLLTTH